MPDSKGVEAVDRALKILGCFTGEAHQLTLADLSRQTGFYKSTILRLAVSLERFDYLLRSETGHFRLGSAAWRLGASYRQSFELSGILRPELRALRDATNETASFYIRERDSRVCLYREEPDRAIRHTIAEGARMPLDRGASGKILTAFEAPDSAPPSDIAQQGFAVSLGERDAEVAAVSVPVFAQSGRLVGAISVSGLITRFDTGRHADLVAALRRSQARLADRIAS